MTDTQTEIRRPDPDPTTLTTAQLQREIVMSRELTESQIAIVLARLDGMDKAVELLQKYPTEVDRAVGRLQALHEEKFLSVNNQFAASEKAVTTAFASAKEAVAKSESNTGERLKSIEQLIQTSASGTEGKISDIKDRITVIESTKKGGDATWGVIAALIGVGVLIIGATATIASMMATAPPVPL